MYFHVCSELFILCTLNLATIQLIFTRLGVPLAPDKLEGPITVLTCLGIELDSEEQIIRVPGDKIQLLADPVSPLVRHIEMHKNRKTVFGCQGNLLRETIFAGLIDLSLTARKLHHRIFLSSEAWKDILWSIDFLPTWNGISVLPMIVGHQPVNY